MSSKISNIPIQIIAIEDDGFHLLIKAEIENMDALLLIDTGASRSVFDINRIKNFLGEKEFASHDKLSTGLGTNSMETHFTELNDLKIGEIIFASFKAVLLDLTHVNESYLKLGLAQIDGVLGSDVLYDHSAIIDYGRSELQLIS